MRPRNEHKIYSNPKIIKKKYNINHFAVKEGTCTKVIEGGLAGGPVLGAGEGRRP